MSAPRGSEHELRRSSRSSSSGVGGLGAAAPRLSIGEGAPVHVHVHISPRVNGNNPMYESSSLPRSSKSKSPTGCERKPEFYIIWPKSDNGETSVPMGGSQKSTTGNGPSVYRRPSLAMDTEKLPNETTEEKSSENVILHSAKEGVLDLLAKDDDRIELSSRKALMEKMLKKSEDMIRPISENGYNVGVFLTHFAVMGVWVFWGIVVITFMSIAIYQGLKIQIPYLIYQVLVLFAPPIFARLMTHSIFGHDGEHKYKDKDNKEITTSDHIFNPYRSVRLCNAHRPPKSPTHSAFINDDHLSEHLRQGDQKNKDSTKDGAQDGSTPRSSLTPGLSSKKKRQGHSMHMTDISLYRLLSAIISFNIHKRDLTRLDTNNDYEEVLLLNDDLWTEVESRALPPLCGVSSWVPLLKLIQIFPLFTLFASQVTYAVLLVVYRVPLLVQSQPYNVNLMIADFIAFLVFWPYGLCAVAGILSMFFLTIRVHHFQLSVFMVRLEHDRIHNEQLISQWFSRRHLIEEYLLHQQTIRMSTEKWQFVLVFVLMLLFLVVLSGIAGFIINQDWTTFAWGVVAALVFLLILFFIAVLNEELRSIKDVLQRGTEEDWVKYEGREVLMQYMESNPTQFTVFGMALTFKIILGVATSLLTANFGAVVAVGGLTYNGGSAIAH